MMMMMMMMMMMIMMQNDLSSHPLEPVSWNFRVFATKGLGCPTGSPKGNDRSVESQQVIKIF